MWPNLDSLLSGEAGAEKEEESEAVASDSSEDDEELAPEKESRLVPVLSSHLSLMSVQLALVSGKSGAQAAVKKKKRAVERDEPRAEGEFAVGNQGVEKLSVADLVAPVEAASAFGSLKKRVQGLEGTATLHTPLPEVQAERELRKAGYEKTSNSVSKFQPMVIAARRAEQLVFPLNAPAQLTTSTASLAASLVPEKDWEKVLIYRDEFFVL